MYLKEGNLLGELLGGGFNWFDTGTFDSYFDAISSIKSIEQNRGRIVACLEQIAYDKGWIDKELLKKVNEEKNVLFTKKSIKLRKKNGYWLPKEE